MAGFSVTESALAGIRLLVKKPWLIPIWGLVYAVAAYAPVVLALQVGGAQFLTALQAVGSHTGQPDPTAMRDALSSMGQFWWLGLLSLAWGLAGSCVLSAAVMRAVLRPGDGGTGYLRFGGDEWRQFLLFLLLFAFAIGVGLVAALVIAMIIAGAHLAGDFGWLVGLVGGLAIAAGFVMLWVRLSLAAPMTFMQGRVRLLESWRVTRNHFWQLFGMFWLMLFFLICVSIALGIVGMIVVFSTGGAFQGLVGMRRAGQMDFSSLQAFLSPAMIVRLIFDVISNVVTLAVVGAPWAAAYGSLTGADLADLPRETDGPDDRAPIPTGRRPVWER